MTTTTARAQLVIGLATLALAALAGPPTALAAGVVGIGGAASCTDAALNTALSGGGLVTFNCGPAPVTIDISPGGGGTGTKTIAVDTTIDGGGLITISGGSSTQLFGVFGVTFTVKDLTIVNGGGTSEGGAITSTGLVTVINSTFSGNRTFGPLAQTGGAIAAASVVISNSTFTKNSTLGIGGAIASPGGVTVTDSTFTGNIAADGGAIWDGGSLTVTNSTFAGNRAIGDLQTIGTGGAIWGGVSVAVTNSTFTGNNADDGGALYSIGMSVVFRNTVVSGSSIGGNCGPNVPGLNFITDGGHNLDTGTSCGFSAANGSLNSTNAHLDPAGLQNNGGSTKTVALCTAVDEPVRCTAASPAIDAGDQAVCAAAPVNNRDQRGFMRPGNGHTHCSIGAYEAAITAPGPCVGDCDGSRDVTVNEIITLVNMALGSQTQLSACPDGLPADITDPSQVDVTVIITAVNNALNGCAG